MTISNRQYHNCPTFDDYLKLPGNSFSSLRGFNGTTTEKMRLGTSVHQYLTDPAAFKGDLRIRIIKPLAMTLKAMVGDLWEYLEHRICVTADFEHEGFVLKYRGELDSGIKGKIVIDYKIGENVRKSMNFFAYPDQLSGYAAGIDARHAFLIGINPKTFKTDVIQIVPDWTWWESQIVLKGEMK